MSGEQLAATWIRPEVRALSAYHVPDTGGRIKLDAMENPYPWPAELVEEWLRRLRTVAVNRYPDPRPRALTERLRAAMRVPPAAAVMLGNGSDELIQIIALALAGPGRVVLAPEPSFVMYRTIALVTGMEYVGVGLRHEDFGLDMAAMREAIARHQPAVIFLAYPNNPTGNLFAAEEVAEIIEIAPGLVIVDEAYAPFAQASFMASLERRANLLVMRTVSKMGLAGLRLGLLAGPRAWIEQFDKVRLPYNVNVLTQVSAEFALAHSAMFDQQIERIRRDRIALYAALHAMRDVRPYPSCANFILFRVLRGGAEAAFSQLRELGILVKNLHGASPLLEDCLRVTVGTPAENRAFIEALGRVTGD